MPNSTNSTFKTGSAEAALRSTEIWSAGVSRISETIAASARSQLDHAASELTALIGAKSFGEARELQASIIRSHLERATNDAKNIQEAYTALIGKTLAPIKAEMMSFARSSSRMADR